MNWAQVVLWNKWTLGSWHSVRLTCSLPLKIGDWETIRLPFGRRPMNRTRAVRFREGILGVHVTDIDRSSCSSLPSLYFFLDFQVSQPLTWLLQWNRTARFEAFGVKIRLVLGLLCHHVMVILPRETVSWHLSTYNFLEVEVEADLYIVYIYTPLSFRKTSPPVSRVAGSEIQGDATKTFGHRTPVTFSWRGDN